MPLSRYQSRYSLQQVAEMVVKAGGAVDCNVDVNGYQVIKADFILGCHVPRSPSSRQILRMASRGAK